MRRWGRARGYENAERLDLVVGAVRAPELQDEALALLDDMKRSVRVGATELSAIYLNLGARTEALRSIDDAVAAREVIFPHVGATLPREWKEKYPEVVAAVKAAGVPIH